MRAVREGSEKTTMLAGQVKLSTQKEMNMMRPTNWHHIGILGIVSNLYGSMYR